MQDIPGALLQAASGSHSGLLISIRPQRLPRSRTHVPAGRRSRRKPAAACGTRASRMHGIRNVQLAGSRAVASSPAEAARCFEVACEPPDARLPSKYARCGENLMRTQQAHTNTRPMPASGWMGATCSRRAPRSQPYRWTSRGRMRGVGATCTAPKTHERPKRIRVPECCKIGAA
jgi:hypothetical protein